MVVGSLQYLLLTRPDVAFVIIRLSQFMHKLTNVHWQAVRRVLRYLSGTRDQGIFFSRHNVSKLHAFVDAYWTGNRDDYTSTSENIV